ncbi:MAG: hypothetical protein JO261_11230 [Alphaproteobacteria bacterium]|nr:hypothetical protein [Alphaproteobacteria bacterium]MBV9694260.1 hypothetical protein [Alphaproteobacteria bacterium]
MTEAQKAHEMALYIRKFAHESELPGYAEMLSRVADDLDLRATELKYRQLHQQPLAA